jgi:hypothetical protein
MKKHRCANLNRNLIFLSALTAIGFVASFFVLAHAATTNLTTTLGAFFNDLTS